MILLIAICVILYGLGAVLARELVVAEAESNLRSSYHELWARLMAMVLWPSLAFYLLTHRDADSDTETP